MSQIIDFHSRKTTQSGAPASTGPQQRRNLLDLSDLRVDVLQALAEAALREHHECPEAVINELTTRATAYAAKAMLFAEKMSERNTSKGLDKLLIRSMVQPDHVRARIDYHIKKFGTNVLKHLILLDEDFKTRRAQPTLSEIVQLIGELATDMRFENEAKHCEHMSKMYAELAAQYEKGQIIVRTAHGLETRTYKLDT